MSDPFRGGAAFFPLAGCGIDRRRPMALQGPSRGISLFTWAREGAGSRQDAPPIRRRVKLRYIRDALRGRASLIPLRCPLAHRRGIAIPGPFGSANRAASSKPARFFRRWRRFAAFLFPTATASLGCGGGPRFLEKENASRPVEEKIAFCRTTGPAGQLAEMRGSSESVPTFNRSLLPSAEYIGCCRDCSAAARRTPAAIVGWKIARPVLLLPRIPLRYALPGQSRKNGAQLSSTARVRQQKRTAGHPGGTTPPVFRDRQGAAAKEEGRASGRDHTSGLP